MLVGDILQHLLDEPFRKAYHPLHMATGTKISAFAGKCQEILMAAMVVAYTSKAMGKVTRLQVFFDYLSNNWSPEPIFPFIPLVIDPYELLKMISDALIE